MGGGVFIQRPARPGSGVERVGLTQRQTFRARQCNHRGIVSAVFERRRNHLEPVRKRFGRQRLAHSRVRRNPARCNQRERTLVF